MKLLMLFGDAAVGKMTVGQELAKLTDLRLFHNHMTIEPVLELFGYFHSGAIARMREVIFEEFAASDNYGMIFTYMWALDVPHEWDYVAHVADIFARQGADIYYAELAAPLEVRLQRNATENRLRHKASKRDLEASERRLRADDAAHRFVSLEGEIPFENYIKIDNTNLSPREAAEMIRVRFGF